jgi:K+-sensing histidine kinase KdpD
MAMNDKPQRTMTESEIASLRQNLVLLKNQLKSGQLDAGFLDRQLDKLDDAMAHLQQNQAVRRKEQRFEALYNVSRALGSSLHLQDALDQVMDAIISLTGAERGFLMWRNDDGGFDVKVARELDQQTLGGDKFKFSRTIINQVLDDGKPVVTTNAAEDPRFAGQVSVVSQSLRSIMAAPLRVRGTVTGVVYVDNRIFAGLFGEDDLGALDALANQAAVAIDNALLYSATDQELEKRISELQTLRRIDRQLNETLDAEKAMQVTLEWACRVVDATHGYLGLIEDNEVPVIRTAAKHGDIAEDASLPSLVSRYNEVLTVASTGKPVTVELNGDSVLIMPVIRDQSTIGVVILERAGQGFTVDQQDLLERVIARAAIAIENARLYDAVRAADRAKSEFVGVVAHDLKTPMTSIAGYADLTLMQAESLNERQREFLANIRNTVKRMEVLVSDLSDISRIESGHFFMTETQVKVSEVIQAVKDNTLPQIQARRHHFVEEIAPNLPDMWVDYYRLLQVLTNLVSNAYKYTPDEGTITLKVNRVVDRIQFSVCDSGIGLSPEAVAMLGTKFWRAEDDFTRLQQGTGLGFAITQALVEQMGSSITIASEVGNGSSFTFDIAMAPGT